MDWEPHEQQAPAMRAADDLLGDMMDAWIQAARAYRLLTAAEEIACAQAIERGGKDAPSPVCPRTCCRTARLALVQHNLRLIVDVARRYTEGGSSHTREDLWQYGVEGLMRAVDRYDWRRGHKFATHAWGWIRQAISRKLVDEGYMVREPVHAVTARNKAFRAGAEPADRIIPLSLSLEVNPHDDHPAALIDLLEDSDAERPFADIERRERDAVLLRALLTRCTRREAVILACRMHGQTLEELGGALGITRERVRQIQLEAIRKLRLALDYDAAGGGGLRERASMVQYIQDSIWQARHARAKIPKEKTLTLAPSVPVVTTPAGTREGLAVATAESAKQQQRQRQRRTRTTRRRGTSLVAGDSDMGAAGLGQAALFAPDGGPAASHHLLSDKPNTDRRGVTSGARSRRAVPTAKGA